MRALSELHPQEALVCTMVLVAAAETGGITDREIGVMATLVQTLPVFEGFSNAHLQRAIEATIGLLGEAEGLPHAGQLIRASLGPRLRETAYTLACDVVAADRVHGQSILRMLEFLRDELKLEALVASAIERATRARYQALEGVI
jgi:tellurite resistance protein